MRGREGDKCYKRFIYSLNMQFLSKNLISFPLVTAKVKGDYFDISQIRCKLFDAHVKVLPNNFAITSGKGNTYLNGKWHVQKKMDIDHHGPCRLMPYNCQHLDPPNVSLPTTFNKKTFIGAVAFLSGGGGGGEEDNGAMGKLKWGY
jgi:hypothetical protein